MQTLKIKIIHNFQFEGQKPNTKKCPNQTKNKLKKIKSAEDQVIFFFSLLLLLG